MIVEVAGTPAPQGSKRYVGRGRMIEMSKAAGPWREAVRAETQRVMSATGEVTAVAGPVTVSLVLLLPRPAGHYGTGRNAAVVRPGAPSYPAGRPDIDKLIRAVLDGLTAAGAWNDDSQVVSLAAAKQYVSPGQPPGCVITIASPPGP